MRYRAIENFTASNGEQIKEGTFIYTCDKPSYGCISHEGIAMTHDINGNYPFFEVPANKVTRDQ